MNMNLNNSSPSTQSGLLIPALPEWTRITDTSQLEIGCEYYITWYSEAWGRTKNTIAEFVGGIDKEGRVSFEHSDLPFFGLSEVEVFVAPRNPKKNKTTYIGN